MRSEVIDATNIKREFRSYEKTALIRAVQMDEPFEVDTREGQKIRGKVGDYLCEGPAGERWPIDQEIFKATLREVPNYRSMSEYKIGGVGRCFAVENDRDWESRDAIGKELIGRRVLINDQLFMVKGIESYAIGGGYGKHMSFGILVHS